MSSGGGRYTNKLTGFAPVSLTGVTNLAPAAATQPCGVTTDANQNLQCSYLTFPAADFATPQSVVSTVASSTASTTLSGNANASASAGADSHANAAAVAAANADRTSAANAAATSHPH